MSTTNTDERSTDRSTDNERSETDPAAAEPTGHECDDCGNTVTRDYHRVFSDNEGVLRSCLHCTPKGTDRGGRR